MPEVISNPSIYSVFENHAREDFKKWSTFEVLATSEPQPDLCAAPGACHDSRRGARHGAGGGLAAAPARSRR